MFRLPCLRFFRSPFEFFVFESLATRTDLTNLFRKIALPAAATAAVNANLDGRHSHVTTLLYFRRVFFFIQVYFYSPGCKTYTSRSAGSSSGVRVWLCPPLEQKSLSISSLAVYSKTVLPRSAITLPVITPTVVPETCKI